MNITELVLEQKNGVVAKVHYNDKKIMGVKYTYPTKKEGRKVVDLSDASASKDIRKSFSKMVDKVVNKENDYYTPEQVHVLQQAKLQYGLNKV